MWRCGPARQGQPHGVTPCHSFCEAVDHNVILGPLVGNHWSQSSSSLWKGDASFAVMGSCLTELDHDATQSCIIFIDCQMKHFLKFQIAIFPSYMWHCQKLNLMSSTCKVGAVPLRSGSSLGWVLGESQVMGVGVLCFKWKSAFITGWWCLLLSLSIDKFTNLRCSKILFGKVVFKLYFKKP